MTNRDRAEKIVNDLIGDQSPEDDAEWFRDAYKEPIEFVTSQLDQAQADVLEQNEPLVKLRINEAVREAEKATWMKVAAQPSEFWRGWNLAKEKTLEIYRRSGTSEEVEQRIRAMEPDK